MSSKLFESKTLGLLRAGPFRRYIIGSLISDSGTWMQMMAQGWVMSTLTNRAILLGLISFAAGLPTIVLTPFGGSAAQNSHRNTNRADRVCARLRLARSDQSHPDLARDNLCRLTRDFDRLRDARDFRARA